MRLVPQMKKFFFRIIGDGVRLVIVILLVLIFLVWFAVISMQLFGYLVPEEGCGRLGSDQFRDFFHVSLPHSPFTCHMTQLTHHMTVT